MLYRNIVCTYWLKCYTLRLAAIRQLLYIPKTMSTTVKHWQGWIDPANMNQEWFETWKRKAEEAAAAGEELVVFRLPKQRGSESNHVQAIEELLQGRIK